MLIRLTLLGTAGCNCGDWVLGLIVDIAWTTLSVYDITESYLHAVNGVATIDNFATTKVDRLFVHHSNYKIDFRFTDQVGVQHSGHARFIEKEGKPIPVWAQQVRLAFRGKRDIAVKFDPRFPVRVWVDNQPVTDLCMLSLLFLALHFCQLCSVLHQRREIVTADRERLHWQVRHFALLPLALETPFVCMLAFFYWLSGGF